MPLAHHLLPRLLEYKRDMAKHSAELSLMVDHAAQISCLDTTTSGEVWSIYLKLDIGSRWVKHSTLQSAGLPDLTTRRAGLPPDSPEMRDLMTLALTSPHIRILGTYTHANFSYNARTAGTAAADLAKEISAANAVARDLMGLADELGVDLQAKFVDGKPRLAVGATPTAHAAGPAWEAERQRAGITDNELVGNIEL